LTPSQFFFFKIFNQTYVCKIILFLFVCELPAQLHQTPNCGNNFNLIWSTFPTASNEYGWSPGTLSNTFSNVDESGIDMSISFEGETSTLGFWAGQTPKIGSQSSYMYKGIDLLTNGFEKDGIFCNISFSKPIYALSFDIHHINFYDANGDKYIITGVNGDGETIYPQFTKSQYPTYEIDELTGTVNAVANLTSGENPIIGVNFANDQLIKSIRIQWLDCEACSPKKPHATGFGNFSFCTPQVLGFDGVDDFINRDSFLGGKLESTMMAWIKPDTKSYSGAIMGQVNFRLFINENRKLQAFIKTESGEEIKTPELENGTINNGIWNHVAISYNGTTGEVLLYLNGEKIWQYNFGKTNIPLLNSEDWNTNYSFEIGRHPELKSHHFNGSINECRVYNKALTQEQLQYQIYQRINNKNERVSGEIIPKDIEGLNWNDLLLYYQMKPSNTGFVEDLSNNAMDGKLNNMQITQEYSAPIPYKSKATSNGNWNDIDNWVNGHSLNIDNIPEFAIVETNGHFDIESRTALLGLIINQGSSINVKNNSGLYNSEYLKLNGELYLQEDSQLLQLDKSVLDITSSGILRKDLYGNADNYTYDYWSSPVGFQNSNLNNHSYSVNSVFDEVTFLETGYDGFPVPLSIADYWIWKFCNAQSDFFTSWQQVGSTGEVHVGEGFTMKGPGSGDITAKQKYTLSGKPNNGTITRNVALDNDYLLGNPYPSAIDAVKFLQDNKETLNGSLYFWKHWAGGTHEATGYQGGYATYSLAGSLPAVIKGDITVEKEMMSLNSVPNRYIPVGQGFYVSAMKNGTIEFNNNQRVFDIPYSQGTVSNDENQPRKIDTNKEEDSRLKIRIRLNSANNLNRQLLLTIDENTTSEVDWGYDSKSIDNQMDDMYWLINNEKYVIQATDRLQEESSIPIGIHTNKSGFNTIILDAIENNKNDLDIFIYDKASNKYHNLSQSDFKIFLDQGEYLDRFEIRFSNTSETLSTNNSTEDKGVDFYYSQDERSFIIENKSSETIESIEMFNILGQSLFCLKLNTNRNYLQYKIPEQISGTYVVKIKIKFGTATKKIAIN